MTGIYWKGKIVPAKKVNISPLNTGFLFGEALFESLPVYGGKPLFFAEHLERLKRGCRFLGWPFVHDDDFEKAIRLFSGIKGGTPDFLIRFNLVQELEGPGNPRNFSKKPPTLFAMVRPLRHQLNELFPLLGKVGISPWKAVDAETLPNGFKIPYYLTTRWVFRKNPGWDEVLKLNHKGEVVDGGASTPFWFDGKKVQVSPLKLGGLESVTRSKILQIIRGLGIAVMEKPWKPREVFSKQKTSVFPPEKSHLARSRLSNGELFFVGSGVGVMAASHLMNRKFRGIPRLTVKLWEHYRLQALGKSLII